MTFESDILDKRSFTMEKENYSEYSKKELLKRIKALEKMEKEGLELLGKFIARGAEIKYLQKRLQETEAEGARAVFLAVQETKKADIEEIELFKRKLTNTYDCNKYPIKAIYDEIKRVLSRLENCRK